MFRPEIWKWTQQVCGFSGSPRPSYLSFCRKRLAYFPTVYDLLTRAKGQRSLPVVPEPGKRV